jgi:hypothetical protein
VLKIDLYDSGSGTKVRLHHHPYALASGCGDECYEYACERTYAPTGETPREARDRLAHTVDRALRVRALGHVAFRDLLADQPYLL